MMTSPHALKRNLRRFHGSIAMRLAHALPAVLSLGALALLASYSMPLPEKARVAWSLSPPPAQAQSNPTEQNAPAQGHAITVLTAPGANPYRDFCVVDASKAGKGPSLFNDLTSPSLREAVAAAVRDPTPDTKLRKKQALKRFETSSPCSWTKYLVCNDNMWGETPDYLKMCTHDPKVDT
ncbi:MAG: hypothetical protein P4L40_03215, partial [Terracidiphilus sp.]|nr:hypothetical protein [Terracidiphilus sp.]